MIKYKTSDWKIDKCPNCKRPGAPPNLMIKEGQIKEKYLQVKDEWVTCKKCGTTYSFVDGKIKTNKRSIYLNGIDVELPLSKVTALKLPDVEMIHLDKLQDGTWQMIYTTETIPEIKELISVDIKREDNIT